MPRVGIRDVVSEIRDGRAEKTISRGASRGAENADEGCATALPAPPALYGRRQEGTSNASLFVFSARLALSARHFSFGNCAVLDAQDDGGPSPRKVLVVRRDEDCPVLAAEPREQLPELVAS